MKIASGNILNNDIKKNHEYEVFYDCEESIAWPDDEFYDCKNTEQYSTTVPISLQEDISRVLSQLAKITLAYEANRFSQHMLFNLGLGIPMTVLNSSWVIYRAIIGKATLSTALITSLPLIFSAILPQAERVTMLAGQIKHWLDKYLTFSLIEEWTSPDDDKFNGYLWLGILALIGHYYCQRTPLQPPQRRYLHLPPKLAELFSRICLYWQVITLEPPPRPVDGFGRLAFDRLEKERQARGRFLARSWARATGNNQQRVEQVAESYYGINRIPLSSTRPSGRAHASRTDADQQPYRQNSLADLLPQAIAAVRALPWPSLGLSGALLPLAQAVPINSMEALAGDQPPTSIATSVATPIPDAVSTILGDPAGGATTPDVFGINALNRYLVAKYPVMAPSGRQADAERLATVNSYIQALNSYWRDQRHLHSLANIINILTQLCAEQGHLPSREIAVILHQLGLHTGQAAAATLHLFDINGYQATDMMVMRVNEDGTVIVYLPRASRHFWVFNDRPAMRQWIIDRCADTAGREEIAGHFALNDRMDQPTLFGKWGVDRWLTNIKTYPERIFQQHEALTLPWHEMIVERQQARAGGDATWLTRPARQILRLTGTMTPAAGEAWLASLLAPSVAATPTPAGMPDKDADVANPVCAPEPRFSAASCAFSLFGAVVREVVAPLLQEMMPIPTLSRQDINNHLQTVSQQLPYWRTMPIATPAEQRIIDKLALPPAAYQLVVAEKGAPSEQQANFIPINLRLKNGQSTARVFAIRMHHTLVPIQYNRQHKFYEIYNINQPNRAGYPVYQDKPQSFIHWRFGYMAELHVTAHNSHERPMKSYTFISPRLYEYIVRHLPLLRCTVTSPGPINSKGISHDVRDHAFLKVDGHYIKISKASDNNIYRIGLKGPHQFQAVFDKNSHKFQLHPGKNAYQAKIIPGDVTVAELNALFNGPPLASQSVPTANEIKQAITDASRLLGDLLNIDKLEDLVVFYPTLYTALGLDDASIEQKKNAVRLLDLHIRKMVKIVENLAENDYGRLRWVPFKQTHQLLAMAKQDPLEQLWINSRYKPASTLMTTRFDARFCRFACEEISRQKDIVVLSRITGNVRTGSIARRSAAGLEADFTAVIPRLLAGNLTPDEVNYLISRPEIKQISNADFQTDRNLAKRILHKTYLPRISLLMDHADLFSRLLLHLHQQTHGKRGSRPVHAWTGVLLTIAAWRGGD